VYIAAPEATRPVTALVYDARFRARHVATPNAASTSVKFPNPCRNIMSRACSFGTSTSCDAAMPASPVNSALPAVTHQSVRPARSSDRSQRGAAAAARSTIAAVGKSASGAWTTAG
jgi:hypothetical protein